MIDPAAVKAKVADFLEVPQQRLEDTALLTDLVNESFLLVQLVIELQEEFRSRLVQEDLEQVRTVEELVRRIVANEIPA